MFWLQLFFAFLLFFWQFTRLIKMLEVGLNLFLLFISVSNKFQILFLNFFCKRYNTQYDVFCNYILIILVYFYLSLSRLIFCYPDPDQRFLKWIQIRSRPNDTDPTGALLFIQFYNSSSSIAQLVRLFIWLTLSLTVGGLFIYFLVGGCLVASPG